jgi:hypothetical protein
MTAVSTPRARLIRQRGRFGAIVVAGMLLPAGVLAGCGDSSDSSAADKVTSLVTEVEADSALPAPRTYASPDVNRERAWEKARVHPNDP